MNLADELSRLAELRDKGVLTPKEFDQRKRKLLRGKRSWWMTALLWIIGTFCFVCLLGTVVAIFVPAIKDHFLADEMACDTPEVQEKVVQLLNQQTSQVFNLLGAGAAAPGMQIHGLGETTELFKDQQSEFLVCLARTKHAGGEGATGYTVAWTDKAKREFFVQTASPEILMARYGGRPQQAQASATEAPATPEPAPREDTASVAKQAPEVQDSASQSDSSLEPHAGKCLLQVHGKTYIDGVCPIAMEPDGSFSIRADEETPIKFFATVTMEGNGLATGYWNEEEGAGHAHSPLGSLRFEHGCWSNDVAKVCAWR